MRVFWSPVRERTPVWSSFSCQGDRPSQQDSLGVTGPGGEKEKGVLAVVADGMGGLAHGGELSRLTVEALLCHFEETPPAGDPVTELWDLCAKGVRQAQQFLHSNPGETGGTTLVAALFRDRTLSFLSVGDSRLCLIRSGGLLWLNRPHSYLVQLGQAAAGGRMPIVEALRDPQSHALTSFVGSDEPLLVDFSPEAVRLLPGDQVLLMSDGVSQTLTEEEIISAVKGRGPKAAARELERAVAEKKRPQQDNYSAVVLFC